jgi:hypothetical protein
MHNNQNLRLGFHWGPNVYAILVATGPKVLGFDSVVMYLVSFNHLVIASALPCK